MLSGRNFSLLTLLVPLRPQPGMCTMLRMSPFLFICFTDISGHNCLHIGSERNIWHAHLRLAAFFSCANFIISALNIGCPYIMVPIRVLSRKVTDYLRLDIALSITQLKPANIPRADVLSLHYGKKATFIYSNFSCQGGRLLHGNMLSSLKEIIYSEKNNQKASEMR